MARPFQSILQAVPALVGRLSLIVVIGVALALLVVASYRSLTNSFGLAASIGVEARSQAEVYLRLQKQMQMAIMHVHHFHIEGKREDAGEFEMERQVVETLFESSTTGQSETELAHLSKARMHWDAAVSVARRILALPSPRAVPLDLIHRDVQQVDMAVMMAVDAVEQLRERNRESVAGRLQEAARDSELLIRLVIGAFSFALLAALGAGMVVLRSHSVLRGLSMRDALTGLLNRREFHVRLQRQILQASRQHSAVSLLLIDVDHFKSVNDRFGHQFGDEVLRAVAERVSAVVRECDAVARFGGEEIAVILPDSGEREAEVIAGRVRAVVSSTPLAVPGGETLRLTVSIGTATFPLDATREDALIRAADTALYEAKENGRDRVCRARTRTLIA